MNIIHDRTYIGEDSKKLIAHGFAAEDLYSLRLSFMYTEEERVANRQFAAACSPDEHGHEAKRRSDMMYEVVKAIAGQFVCYQFDPDCKMPYDSEKWDLFFWCNSFCNTARSIRLEGRDYSYVTLTFNKRHQPEKRREICGRVLAFIGQQFPDHPNLHLAIQYDVRVDQKKLDEAVKEVLPTLLNRLCIYHGMEGKVIQTDDGIFFRKKRAKKYGYRLSEVDILRMSAAQADDNNTLTPYTTPLYNQSA